MINTDKPLAFAKITLEEMHEIMQHDAKKTHALWHLLFYAYQNPSQNGRLVDAKLWKKDDWLINCRLKKIKIVQEDEKNLWHWEENDLVIDVCVEGMRQAMSKRNSYTDNAKRRWEKEQDKKKNHAIAYATVDATAHAEYRDKSIEYRDKTEDNKTLDNDIFRQQTGDNRHPDIQTEDGRHKTADSRQETVDSKTTDSRVKTEEPRAREYTREERKAAAEEENRRYYEQLAARQSSQMQMRGKQYGQGYGNPYSSGATVQEEDETPF